MTRVHGAALANIVAVTLLLVVHSASAADPADSERLDRNRRLFQLAQQPTGLLIPLYHYPAHIHTNEVFNRLIELKKSHPAVPVCAILNPATGPGEGAIDQNYVKAIDRLSGAGVVVLGYVSTRFAAQTADQVRCDISAWKTRYPRVQGLFLDEMAIQPDDRTVRYYASATRQGHREGFWPIVANPGTATPEAFFRDDAADIFIIHENKHWPNEEDLKGDYFGGYADYLPWTRGILLHSQTKLDSERFAAAARQVRWIYVTDDTFDAQGDLNDPQNNPWDTLSQHLEKQFRILSR